MVAFCEYVPSKGHLGRGKKPYVTLPPLCTKLVFARRLTVSIVSNNNNKTSCSTFSPKAQSLAKGVLLVHSAIPILYLKYRNKYWNAEKWELATLQCTLIYNIFYSLLLFGKIIIIIIIRGRPELRHHSNEFRYFSFQFCMEMHFSFVTQNICGDKIAFPEVPWNANIWKLKSNVCIWFVICHLIHVLNAKSFARMPASWISKLHEQSNIKTDSSLGNNKREKCHSASYPCMVPVSYSDFIKY